MKGDPAIQLIANILYSYKLITQFRFRFYYKWLFKSNPCKKCIVQACCTQGCDDQTYWTTVRSNSMSLLVSIGKIFWLIFLVIFAVVLVGFMLLIIGAAFGGKL